MGSRYNEQDLMKSRREVSNIANYKEIKKGRKELEKEGRAEENKVTIKNGRQEGGRKKVSVKVREKEIIKETGKGKRKKIQERRTKEKKGGGEMEGSKVGVK